MDGKRVVVIGAGPAGIAAAVGLQKLVGCSVTIVDGGLDLPQRVTARAEGLVTCGGASVVLEGFGGGGAFSDGKLTLTAEVGGHLSEIVGASRAEHLVGLADELWLSYGAPKEVHGSEDATVLSLRRRAATAGMKLVAVPLRHVGTDRCPEVLARMREELSRGCDMRFGTRAASVRVEGGRVTGVELGDGSLLPADFVVAAPGRSGQPWFQQQARLLGLASDPSPVDLGVRVELPAAILEELTAKLYEFKLLFWSPTFDNLVRTFCVCPYGEVVTEQLGDVVTVNGHSYARRKTDNTNFSLLVSSRFTRPFNDPVAYGQYIARLANLLGDGVLVQRYVDLTAGRRTTSHRLEHCITTPTLSGAAPGDLSYVLPYRHLRAILEMLQAIDHLAPGVAGPGTLLYGVEVKLYSARVTVSEEFETDIKGLFACGDGAGATRGLIQATASGIACAEAIRARVG